MKKIKRNFLFFGILIIASIFIFGNFINDFKETKAATYYTVDSTADDSDDNPGDGNCDNGSGECTLRAAIEEANASAITDEIIEFDIDFSDPNCQDPDGNNDCTDGVNDDNGDEYWKISISSPLTITDEFITIDGYTQNLANYNDPGDFTGGFFPYIAIQIDGDNITDNTHEAIISLSSNDITITGLNLMNCSNHCIYGNSASAAIIQGNYIGVGQDGTSSAGSTNEAIYIYNCDNAIIGNDHDNGEGHEERNVIADAGDHGIHIEWSDNIIVSSNLIGLGNDGDTVISNCHSGTAPGECANVYVVDGNGVTIGANNDDVEDFEEGNIISGCNNYGIYTDAPEDIIISNNGIGLNADRDTPLSNDNDGIYVSQTSNGIYYGDITGNTISGNQGHGINIEGGTDDISLSGNIIGLNENQDTDIANDQNGLNIFQSSNIVIGRDERPDLDMNVFGGNLGYGIYIEESTDITIDGNHIGINQAGDETIGNNSGGIIVVDSQTVLIGTDGDGDNDLLDRNVISGNDGHGIEITSTVLNTSDGISIAGNYIGIGSDGVSSVPNIGSGILINDSSGVTIGTDGDAPNASYNENERNYIGSNDEIGISVGNSKDLFIAGNYVGLGTDNTTLLGNGVTRPLDRFAGIDINDNGGTNCENIVVGTNADGTSDIIERNIIVNHVASAIYAGGANTNNVQIYGNYLGLLPNGTSAANVGNGKGVVLELGYNNTIGVDDDNITKRNHVANNVDGGLFLWEANNNTISGNIIGLEGDNNTSAPNQGPGISLRNSTDNTIGSSGFNNNEKNIITTNSGHGVEIYTDTPQDGVEDAMNNTVVYNEIYINGGDGVALYTGGGATGTIDGNTITRNTIYGNSHLGIDIDNNGVSSNDANDTDNGTNNLVNFPVLNAADSVLGNTTITGNVDIDTDPTQATVELFASDNDVSGYGEGQQYLGSVTPIADGSFSTTVSVSPGQTVTATTTDLNNNTSEFGPYFTVSGSGGNTQDANTEIDINNATPVIQNIVVSDSPGGPQVNPAILSPNTTTTFYIHGSFSDSNGCSEVSSIDGTVYRTGIAGNEACSADNNNCYDVPAGSCTISNCSGGADTDGNFQCVLDIEYYADPTADSTTFAAENWVAYIQAHDSGSTGNDTNDFEIEATLGLDVTPLIAYGTLSLGERSTEQSITVTNTGNTTINYDIRGDEMSCDVESIPQENQKYSLNTGFDYDTQGTSLTDTDTEVNALIPQRTNDAVESTGDLFWMLEIPSTNLKGTCDGSITVTVVSP